MKFPLNIILCFLFLIFKLNAQNHTEINISISENINGTIVKPANESKSNLIILIGGSGPTDRNGNQSFARCDVLKKLAHYFSDYGISSFRYDKRIVTQIRNGNIDKNIMFDDFVNDAKSVINFFKKKYKNIVLVGHSQGSLVGLLSINSDVSGFISLAGVGQPIDKVLEYQISKSAPSLLKETKETLKIMKNGNTTENYPISLSSIFNIDIQPFMINWMKYNPSDIISKISIPSLIINGDKDLQVNIEEAELLYRSAKNSELLIVKNMNHVLVEIEGDDLDNAKSYNNPKLGLSKIALNKIIDFILNL